MSNIDNFLKENGIKNIVIYAESGNAWSLDRLIIEYSTLLQEQFEDLKRQNLELQEKLAAKSEALEYSENGHLAIQKDCDELYLKLAAKEKELSELKNKLEELINSCINNSMSFKASGMDRSQMCSNAMATAYNVVLDYINTPSKR